MRNFVQLIGRLTKEPMQKDGLTGKSLVTASIAYNKNKDHSFFIDLNAWEKSGQTLLNYRKGDEILVSGALDIQSWKDQNGNQRSKVIIVVNYSKRIPRDNERDVYNSSFKEQPDKTPINYNTDDLDVF